MEEDEEELEEEKGGERGEVRESLSWSHSAVPHRS